MQKEENVVNAPENVGLREEAGAGCTSEIKRRVPKKQARKARAEHQMKCCLEPGEKTRR